MMDININKNQIPDMRYQKIKPGFHSRQKEYCSQRQSFYLQLSIQLGMHFPPSTFSFHYLLPSFQAYFYYSLPFYFFGLLFSLLYYTWRFHFFYLFKFPFRIQTYIKNMERNIKFKNQEELQRYAKENDKVLLVFDTYVLDATTFANHHPGGAGLIVNYKSKDITDQMEGHFPLSLIMANTMVIGTFQKQIKKIVDPDKALLPQIWDMDHPTYLKVIDSPHWLFVDSPRMFETDFFQMFSHNKWYNIFIVPTLLMAWYAMKIDWTGLNVLKLIPFVLLGIITFSLTEYLLHRFLFHSERHLFDHKLMRYFHFIMHGIHHMLPVDPDRIVFPPALAVIAFLLGYYLVYPWMHFNNPQVDWSFYSGFMIGYWIYDLTHCSIHYIDTSKSKGSYFHRLQQYHNQHHFGGQQLGFGVSSKFWDVIFRTEMTKKLKH